MESGISSHSDQRTLLPALGRAAGFLMLASVALALLAMLVLLPAHSKLQKTRHELAVQQAHTARAENLITANDRLIAALPHDRTLTRRLVMNTTQSQLIDPAPVKLPAKPTGWAYRAGERLTKPATRRGVFLLGSLALAAALFMFPPVGNKAHSA